MRENVVPCKRCPIQVRDGDLSTKTNIGGIVRPRQNINEEKNREREKKSILTTGRNLAPPFS
jgi:hypothetical protein